jgi:hypothetical protein
MDDIQKYLECNNANDNAKPEEDERNYQPNHAPYCGVGQNLNFIRFHGKVTSGWTASADVSECTRVRGVDLTTDGIICARCELSAHEYERECTPITSHKTYMQDMTPINNT